MKRKSHKLVYILIGVTLLAAGIAAYATRDTIRDFLYEFNQPKLPEETIFTPEKNPPKIQPTPSEASPVPAKSAEEKPVSSAINIAVPFAAQAPHANWDMPYQEACEEASIIMVDAYFHHKTLSADDADRAILDLVAWEEKTFGYYKDTTAAEVVRMLKEYFNFDDVTTQKIASESDFMDLITESLRGGKLIVVPSSGGLLNNPNFTAPPPYHMLVIKGFTEQGDIITNDPGTRRGHNYVYSLKTLFNATHDWNEGDVRNGEKIVIVVGS